jgi:pimeloyl-ACP methyl ester carboxylesterase
MEIEIAGRRIFASTGGRVHEPGLPLVIFLHGAGMDHSVWAAQARWFAHHGRNVLALDLPGHGRSPGAPMRSIGALAELVVELATPNGAARVALAGHSMGALVALEAAAQLGKKASGLALLGMTPAMPVHPDLLASAERGEHRAAELITNWALGRRAQLGANEAPGLWTTTATLRLLERAPAASLAADLAACNDYRGAEEAARRVTCPTLLLLGADDRMTPAAKGRGFASAFREARVTVLPESGHSMMIEDPVATLAALREIL